MLLCSHVSHQMSMNSIIDRHLGPAERQLLYELTLKKRRSKKSTMSEKQVLARQQLAMELMQERRVPSHLDYSAHSPWSLRQCSVYSSSSINTLTSDSLLTTDDQASLFEHTLTGIASHHPASIKLHSSENSAQADNSRSFSGSCGCSFSRSDSSYSGSSQVSGAVAAATATATASAAGDHQQQDCSSPKASRQLEAHEKELLVKINKSRLNHLNTELERRLYQYEYLVAQEKALLGTYNMMLFTSEGVNNFAY